MSEPPSTAATPAVGVFDQLDSRRGRLLGWFWILFWLLFLIEPVAENLAGTPTQRAAAACLVIGAAAYVFAMRYAVRTLLFGSAARGPLPTAILVAAPAVIIAMMLLTGHLLGGETGYGLLPYAGVILAMGLPPRYGLLAAGLLVTAAYALCWALTGAPMSTGLLFSALASAAASGLGAYSIGRNIAARRAQKDAELLRVQDERNRMARDLHDILGHSLTVITMKAELAARLVEVDPARARVQIDEVEALSRSALADVRRAVSGYREISLAGELARARSVLADAGIRAEVPGSVEEVSPDLRELFAWTVREATTNVVRHSRARTCRITVTPNEIRVVDDGRGPAAGPGGGTGHGNGLSGLAERAAAAGARLTTSASTDGGGFTVVVTTKETP